MRFGNQTTNGIHGVGKDNPALYTQASYKGNNKTYPVKPKKVTQKSKKLKKRKSNG